MNSTLNQYAAKEITLASCTTELSHPLDHTTSSQLLLTRNIISHNAKSGLNPITDAAGNLFTIIGKIRFIDTYSELEKLHTDLVIEIDEFFETIKNHGYSSEYILVCRYIMCGVLDEFLTHAPFCKDEPWDKYSLLAAFGQDLKHEEKFFRILERVINEPALYIDLMELMYLCLSMEYKGQYRTLRNGQAELQQITNVLYKHIQNYRGNFTKTLSPTPLKTTTTPTPSIFLRKTSIRTIFMVTACVILTILISLNYLMDVVTNDPVKPFQQHGRKA